MAEVTCELIPLDQRARWAAALQGLPHAFGHTWECCAAFQHTGGLPTFLFVLECAGVVQVACPISEREWEGHTDIVTPYGFSGFAVRSDDFRFEDHWQGFVLRRGYVCGFIGLHPVLDGGSLFEKDRHSYNTLFVFDLQKDNGALFNALPGNRKREISNFEKSGCSFSADKDLLRDFFAEQFYPFFKKKEAPLLYQTSRKTLAALVETNDVLLVGVLREGKVEAVSVFAHTPYAAEYLFNVSLPEGRQHTTNLIWYAVRHYQELGVPYLNLGGGVVQNDSIAKYKERFRTKQYPLQCLRQVYDEATYNSLCAAVGIAPGDGARYFPAYRIKPQAG